MIFMTVLDRRLKRTVTCRITLSHEAKMQFQEINLWPYLGEQGEQWKIHAELVNATDEVGNELLGFISKE